MSRHLHPLPLLLAALGLAFASAAQGAIQETVVRLPARVSDAYGKVVEQDMVVTLFEDDAPSKTLRPIAVLLHGRAADAAKRAAIGRATYRANARWLVHQGFAVVVPTRIGYGETGGEDVESSGACNNKHYPPGYQAAAEESLVAMTFMQKRPGMDPDRVVVIGQSYGGATAIAMAAMNPPGLKAAINFAGGGGGNPETQPQEPCAPHRMRQMFGSYGKTARVPTLWIYTENDQWMGAKYPVQWHQAFVEAGGIGDFVQFGPNGKDGHGLFTQAPDVWKPRVSEFLQQQGLVANQD